MTPQEVPADPLIFGTVERMWEHFAELTVSPKAGALQRSEMRLAFMSGCGTMFVAVSQYAARMPDEVAVEYLGRLQRELVAWSQVTRAEYKP